MFQEYKNNGSAFSDTPHEAVDIEDAICIISTLKSLKPPHLSLTVRFTLLRLAMISRRESERKEAGEHDQT